MSSNNTTNSFSYFDIEVFNRTARGYKINAQACLIWAAIVTFTLLATMTGLFSTGIPKTYKAYFLLFLPMRLPFILIIAAVVSFCVKLYFINRHNKTTYEQRYNILKLYEKIYEAANKNDKKEIMQQALMATIFFEQQNEFNINLMESAQKYFMKNLK